MRLFLGLAIIISSSLTNSLTSAPEEPLNTTLKSVEVIPSVPPGWEQGERLLANKVLKFRLAVKTRHAFIFEQHVVDISTPGHRHYGQHLSQEKLKDWLRPSSHVSNRILSWLESEGAQAIEDNGDWINFRVNATEAERMFDTKFYHFKHVRSGGIAARTLRYSVPLSVHPHVLLIQPTTRFGEMRPLGSTVFDPNPKRFFAAAKPLVDYSAISEIFNATFCNTTVTPSCLRQLYNVNNYKANPKNGNRLGICGYLEQYAKYSDLDMFLRIFAPDQDRHKNNFTYALINGGLATQNDTVDIDVEANLDVQYALALSYLTPSVFYSTGGRGIHIPDLDSPDPADNNNEPYLDFLHYVLSLPDHELPRTLTTSFGEDEQSVPASYTNATCNLFAQLGARGVSVIFASGDTGVGSACQTNDGKNTTRFLPIFPAACPFVTAVGGTFHVEPERAASYSSGGFSDRFLRPSYQDAAVRQYLEGLGSQWEGLYNPAGRGFPDVAAQSFNFSVVDQGQVTLVGGVSAAAPTFAGIVSLLNSARLSAGRPSLGFLNPWIYSVGHRGLNDITLGGSRGCRGVDLYSGLPTPVVPYASWNATPGWDPVTGYGTPDFTKLLELAMR